MTTKVYLNNTLLFEPRLWLAQNSIVYSFEERRSFKPHMSAVSGPITVGAPEKRTTIPVYFIYYLDFQFENDALLFRLRWSEYVL
jgi:hypothetical protein